MGEAATPAPSGARRRAGPVGPLRETLHSAVLRRVLVAFFLFNTGEWAIWIAGLVWAFDVGGASGAALLSVVETVPAAIVAPFAAALGDRLRRDHALALGYGLQAVTMTLTGTALLAGAPVPVVYVLAAASATSVVLTRPVHNAIIPELAQTPEQLTAANAASSTVNAASLFVGPLACSVLIGWSGPGSVYLVVGLVGFGSALLTGRLALQRTFPASTESPVRAAVAGLKELRRDRGASLLTLIAGVMFAVLGIMQILLVVLSIDTLDLGPSSPGVFASIEGVGALVGAAGTVALIGRRRLSPALAGGMVVTGVPLMLVAGTSAPVIAGLLLAITGIGSMFADVAGRTLLQRSVRPDVLARIFGVQESLMMGGTALGAVLASLLVNGLGSRGAFLATGLVLPVVAATCWAPIRRLDARAAQPGTGFDLLAAVPLFAMLPQATLELLSRQLQERTFDTGADIVREGEPGELFYLISHGNVDIVHGGRTITRSGPGDYFGEVALLRDVPRVATVRTREPVTTYFLDRDHFLTAVTGHPTARQLAHGEADRRVTELDP